MRRRETTALTGKIHNAAIEFDFGPVFEHGLERGTGIFCSFHLGIDMTSSGSTMTWRPYANETIKVRNKAE
jgi:hypothetical protein